MFALETGDEETGTRRAARRGEARRGEERRGEERREGREEGGYRREAETQRGGRIAREVRLTYFRTQSRYCSHIPTYSAFGPFGS